MQKQQLTAPARSGPAIAQVSSMRNQLTHSTKIATLIVISALLLALSVPALAQNQYRGNGPGLGLATSTLPLTADETASLTFMREEEKLARDLYAALDAKWNLAVFKNITLSEDRHFDALGVLLSRYNVPDPAKTTKAGVYSDASLNALYLKLIAKGTISVKDALEVGVIVEKKDIEDLKAALTKTTKPDITRVYTNLLNGSFNHLEAFETCLEILVPASSGN
jgi:hypothetical protein